MWWEFTLLSALALYLFYRWMSEYSDVFVKRGVPCYTRFPLFPTLRFMVFDRKSLFDRIMDTYSKHDGPFFGTFAPRKPVFIIRDPELIKQITIKDFDHFVNHVGVFGESTDSNLLANSLFQMKDAKWKDMRSTLSPVFTGSKLRQVFQLINQVADESVKYLKQQGAELTSTAAAAKGDGLELDMKDYSTRFTNDIVASVAFGLQVNSYANQDNEFYRMGKKVTTFTGLQSTKFMLHVHCPKLMKWLGWNLFDKPTTDYFMHLVLDAMKYRKEHNIVRPDMINMLMEARGMVRSDSPKIRDWSDVEIVAQCFVFFFAGFESVSVLICFAAHELMENPETQQKLLEEITEVEQQLEGKSLTYEALQGMKYMDMVVSETLRKWPPSFIIDRVCNKDFTGEINGERLDIKTGEGLWVPTVGIQRDPKYFENPQKFDPERFSAENKHNIQPFTYLPFGLGPRNCIGSRFALLEVKAILYYLVRDFSIEAAKKTTIPLKLASSNFQMKPKNGFWLKFVGRS